ncbi:MAG: hypothetical protein AYP45_14100 [Candidatus Brocadia carolinensis]|uniref:Uncharacterized protein n=1 Tax=Candidatus Brocadia carolinensis TaxID=1004156 RepID=A0A1V4AQZ4_9BACT|nr:MAG: hypothetical protein AYP45_14100 [Candidatus Brocadia caroliniensis]
MVITNYLLRWGIEHCFKELKDTFYLDHYQARHINKIVRYRNLRLVAWTHTYKPVLVKTRIPILRKSLKQNLLPSTESNRLSTPCSNSPLPRPYQRTKNSPMTISKLNRND